MATRSARPASATRWRDSASCCCRHRDAGHAAAPRAGRMHGKAAPPGTDFEHVIGRANAQGLAPSLELPLLRDGQRLVGRLEHGARIGQRRIQERREQFVAEVVVRADVAAAAAPAVPAANVQPVVRQVGQRATATSRAAGTPRCAARVPRSGTGRRSASRRPCTTRRHRDHRARRTSGRTHPCAIHMVACNAASGSPASITDPSGRCTVSRPTRSAASDCTSRRRASGHNQPVSKVGGRPVRHGWRSVRRSSLRTPSAGRFGVEGRFRVIGRALPPQAEGLPVNAARSRQA